MDLIGSAWNVSDIAMMGALASLIGEYLKSCILEFALSLKACVRLVS